MHARRSNSSSLGCHGHRVRPLWHAGAAGLLLHVPLCRIVCLCWAACTLPAVCCQLPVLLLLLLIPCHGVASWKVPHCQPLWHRLLVVWLHPRWAHRCTGLLLLMLLSVSFFAVDAEGLKLMLTTWMSRISLCCS